MARSSNKTFILCIVTFLITQIPVASSPLHYCTIGWKRKSESDTIEEEPKRKKPNGEKRKKCGSASLCVCVWGGYSY